MRRPDKRYVIKPADGSMRRHTWQVIDLDADGGSLPWVTGLTKQQALNVLGAVQTAWWEGVRAYKTGGLIV